MDKDSLQKQLESMEEASERWRSERRRLNSEIDKLETALSDAKTSIARKTNGTGDKSSVDPLALAKVQEAADQKLKQATEEWEAERSKLTSKINRLEGGLAEAIARASNPLRVTQSVKEQFELELNRVAKEKTDLEQAFLRGKTEWEQEKLKMTGEMVKLRRAAQIMGRPIPTEDFESNPKVRDMQNQLKENLAQWNTERSRLVVQIQKLEENSRDWGTERRKLQDHAADLQESLNQAEAKIQSLEIAARKPNAAKAQVEELEHENEALQKLLRETQNAYESEQNRLALKIEQLKLQLQQASSIHGQHISEEVVDLLRQQYEKKLQEAFQQKEQLAHELETANSLLEAERVLSNRSHTGTDNQAVEAEISRVETQINEIVAIIENPNSELSTVIRKNVEKAELDSYMKGILFALGRK
jgi:chromosome segregation ATPase